MKWKNRNLWKPLKKCQILISKIEKQALHRFFFSNNETPKPWTLLRNSSSTSPFRKVLRPWHLLSTNVVLQILKLAFFTVSTAGQTPFLLKQLHELCECFKYIQLLIQNHTVKYQFEMPLEEHVSRKKYILVYTFRQKQVKKKFTSYIVLFSYQPISAANLARKGWIGRAGYVSGNWKRIMWEVDSFSFTTFAYESRPKYIFSRDMFFKRFFQFDLSQCETRIGDRGQEIMTLSKIITPSILSHFF